VRELQAFEEPMNRWGKRPEDIGAWYMTEVRKWCAKSDGTILVVEEAEKLMGYAVLLCKCEEDGADGDVAYTFALVADLAVTKAARGRGIGTALLRHCEGLARAKDVKVLRIGVMAGNANAIGVYQHFGFAAHHHTLEKMLE
jgi:GNAT superfamily N-acetyltransferase